MAPKHTILQTKFTEASLPSVQRVIINATLDIGEERYRTQLILFDITPVMDVYSGREPGRLTLME